MKDLSESDSIEDPDDEASSSEEDRKFLFNDMNRQTVKNMSD